MAKELPYFKFEPSAWETGKIQLFTFELQGIFINICSMYWQRLGDLPYKLALQKICGGNATALDSLCEEGVIKVIDDHISIDFLNEQLAEFKDVRSINSKNARSGWEKRRKDATALRPQSEGNAIREEEIRVERKNTRAEALTLESRKDSFYKSLLPQLQDYGKDVLREFYDYWTEASPKSKKLRFEKEKAFEIPKRLIRWKNRDLNKSPADSKPAEPYAEARHNRTLWTKEAWEEKYADKIAFDKEFQKAFGYDKL
jgi:hypothetical protein